MRALLQPLALIIIIAAYLERCGATHASGRPHHAAPAQRISRRLLRTCLTRDGA